MVPAIRPRVTVGICFRNCRDFIGETIKSIVNQDFPHELMELIFVDDGSEDDTLQIVNKHLSQIDITAKSFHFSWKGIGSARNVVVANAKGEFIIWVDGDMVLARDFVRRLVDLMDLHSDLGIAKGKQSLKTGGNLLGNLEALSRAVGRMVNYQSKGGFSKALGTGGAIYRVQAIRNAGGFDENLKRYGEDWDLEIRLRSAGWLLQVADTEFSDYERHKLTWRGLWLRYWLRGYCTHYLLHKKRGLIKLYRMFPPLAFLTGFLHSLRLFRLTYRKSVFLLPFQYLFKMSAWYTGFIRSHMNSYAPR